VFHRPSTQFGCPKSDPSFCRYPPEDDQPYVDAGQLSSPRDQSAAYRARGSPGVAVGAGAGVTPVSPTARSTADGCARICVGLVVGARIAKTPPAMRAAMRSTATLT